MSALRKKIAEKKANSEAEKKPPAPLPPPPLPPPPAQQDHSEESRLAAAPSPASTLPPPPPPPVSKAIPRPSNSSGMKQGWLSKGLLYPEGSSEAAPKMWRATDAAERPKVFQVLSTADEYEVCGDFSAAGRFIGKEDFRVTRDGLRLRIQGNPNEDPQSLVAGLDEVVTLPIDAAFEGMSAEYTKTFALSIRIPRSREVQELLAQLSIEEREAIEARLADPLVEPLLHELPAAADAPVYEAATGASASNTNESGGAGAGASLARADGAPANAAANEPPQLPAEVSAVRAAEAVDDGDAADAA